MGINSLSYMQIFVAWFSNFFRKVPPAVLIKNWPFLHHFWRFFVGYILAVSSRNFEFSPSWTQISLHKYKFHFSWFSSLFRRAPPGNFSENSRFSFMGTSSPIHVCPALWLGYALAVFSQTSLFSPLRAQVFPLVFQQFSWGAP